MAGPGFDALARDLLCDLLDRLGPGAPTLLPSWTTHDLAAQLVVREHELLAAPGLVVPGPWSRVAERRRLTARRRPFSELDRAVQARRGRPVARVHGRPGELLLFAFGRERAAAVEITGPAEAVDAVHRARFGM